LSENERLPERKVKRTEGESAFQREGPTEAIETETKLFSDVELRGQVYLKNEADR